MSHGIMATYTTGCFCRRKTLTVAGEKYSAHAFPGLHVETAVFVPVLELRDGAIMLMEISTLRF